MVFLALFSKINFLLSISSMIVFALYRASSLRYFRFPHLYRLQISYLLLVLSISLPFLTPYFSINIGSSLPGLAAVEESASGAFWFTSISKYKSIFRINVVYKEVISYLFLSSMVMGWTLFILQIFSIYRKTQKMKIYRKIGNVSVAWQSEGASPYVYSLLGRRYVVLPTYLGKDKQLLGIAVKHELQHLRQKDTSWIYLLNFIMMSFYVNPLVHLIIRNIKNNQELACDEELILNKKVKFKSYIHSLLKIAELLPERKSAPFFANTILREGNKSNLRERVDMMIKIRKNSNKGYLAVIVLFLSFLVLSGSAYAVRDVQPGKSGRKILLEMVMMEKGKVISRPKLIALDGETSEIKVGDDKGNTIAMIFHHIVTGAEVEMDIERTVTKNGVVRVADNFSVRVHDKIKWTNEMQENGTTYGFSVTPTIIQPK